VSIRGRLIWGFLAAVAILGTACSWRIKNPLRHGGDDRTVGGDQRVAEPTAARDDVVAYAQHCKQELGLPPETLASWNCLQGREVPITVNGDVPNEAVYAELAAHKQGCDKPSWLGEEPCSNYAFVEQRALSPDVDALILCRMRSFTSHKDSKARRADLEASPTEANFRAYYQFDSLGLIWTNKRNGKTCYFDFVGTSYGGYVPSPDDERVTELAQLPDPKPTTEFAEGSEKAPFWRRNARGTWRPPRQVAEMDQCARCHDTGPYKSSPWIEQVLDLPRNDPTIAYEIIGRAFDPWRVRYPPRAISTLPIQKADGTSEAQVCTSCHRIGAHATCEHHMEYSVGKASPSMLSDRGKTFSHRIWMPPGSTLEGKTEDELQAHWNTNYETHVARLKCCCLTPGAKGCTSQDFSKSPIPAPVEGVGPKVCP
jgi:hypothetical protein